MASSTPWFRFYSEALHDRKIAKAAQAAGVQRIVAIGAWVSILSLASESPHRGKLLVTLLERFTEQDIADELGIDETITKNILNAFIQYEMLYLDNGVYCVTNWEKRQFDSDISTERVRKHREKLHRNVSVTPPEAEAETETYLNNELTDHIEACPLATAFTKTTKITPGNMAAWNKASQELTAAGITEDEISIAVEKMDRDGLTYSGLPSIVKTAVWVHSRRMANKPVFTDKSNDNGNRKRNRLPIQGV